MSLLVLGGLFFAVVALICLTAVILGMALLFRLFAGGSGYAELARRFPAGAEPIGPRYSGQHVQVGAVRWRRAATLVFAAEGLYLAFLPTTPLLGSSVFSKHPPVLIPYSEIRAVRPARLYWQQAVALTIGDPQIAVVTLLQPFYSLLEPHLAAARARR
jgi:hypothetical protein